MNLIIDQYLGKKFPSNFSEADFQNIQHLHSWYNYFIYRDNLAKAKIFWKTSKILNDFDNRIKNINNNSPRFSFLSGHDTDIFPFNNVLNFSSSECVEELYRKGSTSNLNCQPMPSFASSLIFELHSEDEINFYVRIRSDGKYMNLCE